MPIMMYLSLIHISPLKARPNEEDIDLDLTARLDARVTDNIDIALSGNYNDKTDRFLSLIHI